MADLRVRARSPECDPMAIAGAGLAVDAASGIGAPLRRGALVREMGRRVALLAFTGATVGGGLSMVVVAVHSLGR